MASKPIVRDFIGAVLQAIVGCLCAGQALAAPRWDLTVTLNPSTEQLTVRGCSNQGQARVHLWAGPTAAHFLRGSRRGDAKLETGAEISVPSFVDIGTVVRIDTETGEYLDRVKK